MNLQVLHARSEMVLNFSRDWVAYREGFGDPEAEYWIGTSILTGETHLIAMSTMYYNQINSSKNFTLPALHFLLNICGVCSM